MQCFQGKSPPRTSKQARILPNIEHHSSVCSRGSVSISVALKILVLHATQNCVEASFGAASAARHMTVLDTATAALETRHRQAWPP
jgi:hypothetical protein